LEIANLIIGQFGQLEMIMLNYMLFLSISFYFFLLLFNFIKFCFSILSSRNKYDKITQYD